MWIHPDMVDYAYAKLAPIRKSPVPTPCPVQIPRLAESKAWFQQSPLLHRSFALLDALFVAPTPLVIKWSVGSPTELLRGVFKGWKQAKRPLRNTG
ncbi:hypothetical protein ACSS6W_002849 [Trichoderma asperelloides]